MSMCLVNQNNISKEDFDTNLEQIIKIISDEKYDITMLETSYDYYQNLSNLVKILKNDPRVDLLTNHQRFFIESGSPNSIIRM